MIHCRDGFTHPPPASAHKFDSFPVEWLLTLSNVLQVVQALRHLHLRRIVHCDLKPENILVADADDGGDGGGGGDELRIKLADWGFAQVISPHKSLDKVLGTGAYMAPEILARHSYDEKVDVWSAGVIFYVLLCGFPPYNATYDHANRLNLDGTLESILEKTRDGAWDWFPSPYWDAVSPEAKAFVRSLLTVDPMLRPSAEQCLKADWYSSLLPLPKASGAGQQQISGESLPGLREQLQKLNASRARTAIEHCLGGALGHTRSGAAIVGPALSADIGGEGGADKDFILEELGWQPLISLAWSGDDEDRKIAATGLANASANKSQMQVKKLNLYSLSLSLSLSISLSLSLSLSFSLSLSLPLDISFPPFPPSSPLILFPSTPLTCVCVFLCSHRPSCGRAVSAYSQTLQRRATRTMCCTLSPSRCTT